MLAAIEGLVGAVAIDPKPQEVPWSVLLTEDEEHARYDPQQVEVYFTAATYAALVLAAFRAPVSRALHAGECLVGFVRSCREPVLGPPRRATLQ